MKDLPRLLEASTDPLELAALRSASDDHGSQVALSRALGAMATVAATLPAAALPAAAALHGAAASTTAASGAALPAAAVQSATVSASAVKGTLALVALKSVGVGIVVGGACLTAATAIEPTLLGEQPRISQAPVASAARSRVQPSERRSALVPRPEVPLSAEQPESEPASAASALVSSPRALRPLVSGASLSVPAAEAAPVAVARESELSRELAFLDSARRELRAGNPTAALTALDRREREISLRVLNPEATLVRVEALLANGERDRARRLANDFISHNASGPHAERMRRLIAK